MSYPADWNPTWTMQVYRAYGGKGWSYSLFWPGDNWSESELEFSSHTFYWEWVATLAGYWALIKKPGPGGPY